jgi:hypothetical protein
MKTDTFWCVSTSLVWIRQTFKLSSSGQICTAGLIHVLHWMLVQPITQRSLVGWMLVCEVALHSPPPHPQLLVWPMCVRGGGTLIARRLVSTDQVPPSPYPHQCSSDYFINGVFSNFGDLDKHFDVCVYIYDFRFEKVQLIF